MNAQPKFNSNVCVHIAIESQAKERNPVICFNRGEPRGLYKLNKPGKKDDFIVSLIYGLKKIKC